MIFGVEVGAFWVNASLTQWLTAEVGQVTRTAPFVKFAYGQRYSGSVLAATDVLVQSFFRY